jgi:hypothetical protein
MHKRHVASKIDSKSHGANIKGCLDQVLAELARGGTCPFSSVDGLMAIFQ